MKTDFSVGFLYNGDRGMTLIDMSVLLVVVGLLAVPLIQAYHQYREDKAHGTVINNMVRIDKAIADFYFANGFYPCPSDITLAPGSANYGMENCPLPPAPVPVVEFGGIPFVALKIPEAMSLDGWSNRLKYAVTGAQARGGTLPIPATGAITVNGFNQIDALPLDPTNQLTCSAAIAVPPKYPNVHYVVVSLGPSGAGAYSADGVANPQACPPAGTTLDADNCIDDSTFLHDICAVNTLAGATFYDDTVSPALRTAVPQRLWSAAANVNMTTALPTVGINIAAPDVNNPDPTTAVDVRGNIRANNLYSNTMCDVANGDCFNPAFIAGNMPRMDCTHPAYGTHIGTGITGIGDDPSSGQAGNIAVKCGGSYLPSAGNCPAGQSAIGISAAGVFLCAP